MNSPYVIRYPLIHAPIAWGPWYLAWMRGTVLNRELAAVRDDLAVTLEETLKLARRLAEDARDTDVPVAELVAQATMLGRLDQQREELIGELGAPRAPGCGPTTPGRPSGRLSSRPRRARLAAERALPRGVPVGQAPAPAGQPRVRLAAPRRAEGLAALTRCPVGLHRAALNPDGSANPRWLTSSAWGLPRRVIASAETERLFDLQKILALHGPRLPRPARHPA